MKGSSLIIRGPEDLRGRSLPELEELAQDIRQRIISTCLKNGGHLGASLGAVELAIALHTVFESPQEPIVWDVGHQAYAHKMICGRWETFETLRQSGGISGFLQRTESPHDIFGAGHSSTSLSVALAIAWKKGRDVSASGQVSWTVAVVGDGGLTAGLALEALNNLRNHQTGPLLVVLNDNQMSISENVGNLSAVFSGDGCQGFFEQFGFEYHGPVDGHHLGSLVETLREIRHHPQTQPVLLHVRTQKGRGYLPAEERPASYHGVNPVQPVSIPKTTSKSYSQGFGEALCELAKHDDRIVAITAAMPEGTGLIEFAKKYPDRFFDVGIAEAHAVTFAAGLASQGLRPVVAIYSTFLQRSVDSIIHDVALQNLGVTFAIDRAGIVGQDGPTHHGAFDLAYLGMIPNLTVSAPSCLSDLQNLLRTATSSGRPWAIRYPRGSGSDVLEFAEVDSVRWHRKAKNPQVIAIALGSAASRLVQAAQDVDSQGQVISVLSTIQAKPIPDGILRTLIENPQARVLCVEDGSIRGGFGQALWAEVGKCDRSAGIAILGYEDHFIVHGSVSELERIEGVSVVALADRLRQLMNS